MDILNPVVVLAPLILGALVRGIIRRIEEARQNTCDSIRIEPAKQLRELAPTTKTTKKKPIKRRGKFPEWVKQLSERELVDRIYASLRDRPIEEAIKIISGGETIWLSGHREDEDFSYSEEGRDLIPVTLYHN